MPSTKTAKSTINDTKPTNKTAETPKPTTKTPDPAELSINERILKLNEEVEWFYSDDFSLDRAVEKYETTLAHAKSIQKDLETLRNRIVKIEEDFTKA